MKLGIIGSGVIVEEFLPELLNIHNIEVKAIESTKRSYEKAKALANRYGIKNVVTNFEDLSSCSIDTIYIATPNHIHFEYAKKALEKGFHVIVEKPMTVNDQEAKYLKEYAIKHQLFLFEAITTPYLPQYHKIEELLLTLGKIQNVECYYSQYSRRYEAFKKGELPPVFDLNKAGGALMDLNSYNLHFIIGLFGKPKDITYEAVIEKGIDVAGELSLIYDEFIAKAFAAKDRKEPFYFLIEAEKGKISLELPPNMMGNITVEKEGNKEIFEYDSTISRAFYEFTFFEECIRKKDYKKCYEMLERSIIISNIQTQARKKTGIIFPMDKE